jgi:ATP-binding cassette subfamily B protein
MGKYPIIRQLDAMDCGAACLAMISEYYGLNHSFDDLRNITFVDLDGVSWLDIDSAAKKIGFVSVPVKVSFYRLQTELPLPAIAHYDQNHFVVVYEINDTHVIIGDPAYGERRVPKQNFLNKWLVKSETDGIVLLLEYEDEESGESGNVEDNNVSYSKSQSSTNRFENSEDSNFPIAAASTSAASSVFTHLKGNTKFWLHFIFGSILLGVIYLLLPLVIKELIDGVQKENFEFLESGLFAFAMLGLGRIVLELSRNWMFQAEAAATNAKLVSSYLEKLSQQPIRFFEKRLKWDILQRVYDNYRVGAFFQSSSVQAVFFIIMLAASSVVLLLLHPHLFVVFILGILIQITLTLFFKRRRLYAKQSMVESSAKSQDSLFEMINGITAIKLNNAEAYYQSIWEKNQADLLTDSLRFHKIDQYQKTSIKIIGWIIELVILYMGLKFYVEDKFTIGSIMAVIYILAYSKNAIVEFFEMIAEYQEVQLSFRRLSEVSDLPPIEYKLSENKHLSTYKDFEIKNLSFKYGDVTSPIVLNEINLTIPKGKKTAIVVSGSGKTTLIKLLVGMYKPKEGSISLGGKNLSDISPSLLNRKMGIVFEDGYIFSDSIESNITLMESNPDTRLLDKAIGIACLETFTNALPLGLKTRIGENGIRLSKGQQQQVLLARAFYKQPEVLFLDEATNALDGITERRLLKNIKNEFEDKTRVFVAHRLNSIQDADQILVLHKGAIIEAGTHKELLEKRGAYYLILRNDLE